MKITARNIAENLVLAVAHDCPATFWPPRDEREAQLDEKGAKIAEGLGVACIVVHWPHPENR